MRLHREHGLNPTIPTYFWCGEDRDEIVLLGASYRDEAPRRMTLDHEPCKKCRDVIDQGYMIFEAKPDKTPTGRWVVINLQAAERMRVTSVPLRSEVSITFLESKKRHSK